MTEVRVENPHVRTLRIALPTWVAHLPGQHYDVRLTAPDGYRAQRSYSVASSPLLEGAIEFTVDRLEEGEVSPYLHDVLVVGDGLEVRGPFASYFVWRGERPLLLMGGGSGVVPLMAMLRHQRLVAPDVPARLVLSVRAPEDVIYRDELGEETTVIYTRRAPAGWPRAAARIDRELLAPLVFDDGPVFVCGTNSFVEAATELLLGLGCAPERIRTERFGGEG